MQLEQRPRSVKSLPLAEQDLEFQYTKLPCLQNRICSEVVLKFLEHSQLEIAHLLIPLVVATLSINSRDFTGKDRHFLEARFCK